MYQVHWRVICSENAPTNSGHPLFPSSFGEVSESWTGVRQKKASKLQFKGRRCHTDVGAPENRIMVPKEHVLTPRGSDIYPGTWTRGHRLPKKTIVLSLLLFN